MKVNRPDNLIRFYRRDKKSK